ncbi:MAG: radical SAM protein [Bacteroidota bacterium]
MKSYILYVSGRDPVSLEKKTILGYNRSRKIHKFKHICHAPFTNMYFGLEGKIGACCYNVTHLLGRYPQSSIMQAWQGEAAGELRAKIKNVDMTAGCYCCQVQLVEKAFHTVLAGNYDDLSPKTDFPLSMEFELSNKCNLECIMCSEKYSSVISAKRGIPNYKEVYDDGFIDQLKTFIPYLHKAKFLGGEPFLIPVYYKIWDAIIELNPACEIIVQSNGTILNKTIKALLKRGNFSISLSIDSLNKQNYELIRKNADFDTVYENMLYFIEFCKRNNRYIGIASCFMKQNWQDIPDLLRFFGDKQVPVTFNRVWEPAKCSVWHSSPDLIQKILSFYAKQTFRSRTPIEKRNAEAFGDLINQLMGWYQNEKLKADNQFDYDNTPLEKLEQIIMTHIFDNEAAKQFTTDEKKEVMTKFENAINQNKERNNYKQVLIKALEIPGEILLRELLNNSSSRIDQQVNDLFENEQKIAT